MRTRGRFARRAGGLAAAVLTVGVGLGLGLGGCGYAAVYGAARPPEERLSVVLVRAIVPDAVAADEVVAGARERLAREGALRPGEGYPRLEIEVLRADEMTEGALADPRDPRGGAPRARGVSRALVVRGIVRRVADGPPERDTGDLRAQDTFAAGRSPAVAAVAADDAVRATARRLGHRVALRALGFPVPADETAGVER